MAALEYIQPVKGVVFMINYIRELNCEEITHIFTMLLVNDEIR